MPGKDTWSNVFLVLSSLLSSCGVISHCQKARVKNGISIATVKHHLVFCINYMVNHGNTTVLFYNNTINNVSTINVYHLEQPYTLRL